MIRVLTKTLPAEFAGLMANAAQGAEDTCYSDNGTLQTSAGRDSGDGGLMERYAKPAARSADILPDKQLFESPTKRVSFEERGKDIVTVCQKDWKYL